MKHALPPGIKPNLFGFYLFKMCPTKLVLGSPSVDLDQCLTQHNLQLLGVRPKSHIAVFEIIYNNRCFDNTK